MLDGAERPGPSFQENRSTVKRRPLGESGIEVSVIALGTWAMGADVAAWGHVDDRESIAAIHLGLDSGVNLIDTAPIYGLGHAEEILGKALQGRRHEAVVATKCGLVPGEHKGRPPSRSLTPEGIMAECEASLRRLQTDFIDLYQCHWPDPQTPIERTMEALLLLQEQGKIRAIGLSNFGIERIEAARAVGPISSLQPQFSMIEPRAADDLIPYCVEHRISVLPYSPLGKGLLTGKFDRDTPITGARASDPAFVGARFEQNLAIVRALTELAQSYERTVGQLVLNWTVNYPGVTAPIVGVKRPSHVADSVGSLGWSITEEDQRRIDEILRGSTGAV